MEITAVAIVCKDGTIASPIISVEGGDMLELRGQLCTFGLTEEFKSPRITFQELWDFVHSETFKVKHGV